MEQRKIIRLVVCAAAILLLPALAGCTGWKQVDHTTAPRLTAHKDNTGLRWTHVGYTTTPRLTTHENDTGLHWTYVPHTTRLRQITYYDYYYYPDSMVYYHIHTGYYYYYIDGGWQHSKQRPKFVYLDDGRRQSIVIRNAQPYAQHASHRRQFPAQPIPPGHARAKTQPPLVPQNNAVGGGQTQPAAQPKPKIQSVAQPKPKIQSVAQPQPAPQPRNTGQAKGKPVQPCNQNGKGKSGNTCG